MYVKFNYLGTTLYTLCAHHFIYFQYYDVFAKRKQKIYIILNEYAQDNDT